MYRHNALQCHFTTISNAMLMLWQPEVIKKTLIKNYTLFTHFSLFTCFRYIDQIAPSVNWTRVENTWAIWSFVTVIKCYFKICHCFHVLLMLFLTNTCTEGNLHFHTFHKFCLLHWRTIILMTSNFSFLKNFFLKN